MPADLLGGLSTHGTGRFERAIEASQKQIAADPDLSSGIPVLRPAISSWTVSPKRSARFNEPPNASWRSPISLMIRYNIAVLKGDKDQMDRQWVWPRASPGGTRGGSRGGSRSGSFRPASTGPAVIEPRHGSGPARGGTRGGSELPGRTSGVGSRVRECRRREKERHGGAGAFERPGCRIRRRPCPGSFGRLLSIATACR